MTAPLKILLIDDEDIVHQTIGDYLQSSGHRVDSSHSGADGLTKITNSDYDLVFTDIRMPGMDGLSLLSRIQEEAPDLSLVIITGHRNMEMAVQALRLGATDFLTKPIKLLELDAVLEKVLRLQTIQHQNKSLNLAIENLQSSENYTLIGSSQEMQTVSNQIQQANEAECETILITGETGTGKEVVARALHFQDSHKTRPFIAVSCPTIPDTLIESELFGVVKGAFTGASSDRPGYFELADNGTLFLDEIADLSLPAQAAMLRAIETRTIRPVGSGVEKKVDVRIIAATHTRLEDLVKTGKFRQDLLYRLNLYTIHLPPLRDRKADILDLARHFLNEYATRRGIAFDGFSDKANQHLLSYEYPGNIRELRHIIERAGMLCKSGEIGEEHIILPEQPQPSSSTDDSSSGMDERTYFTEALEKARWNRKQAAKDLGIPYSTLRYKLQQLGIK